MFLKQKILLQFKVYWAPAEIFEERESFLKEITGCFARTKVLTDDILTAKPKEEVEEETPEGFKKYKGKYFQLDKATGYTISEEKEGFIQLVGPDQRTLLSYIHSKLRRLYT